MFYRLVSFCSNIDVNPVAKYLFTALKLPENLAELLSDVKRSKQRDSELILRGSRII